MKAVKISEIQEKVRQIEDVTAESGAFVAALDAAAERISAMDRKRPVRVLTDYDADGITSGYIMQKALDALGFEDVKVTCNDRAYGYGVMGLMEHVPREDASYIVLDMGTNEQKEIGGRFGRDAVIIDHHIPAAPPADVPHVFNPQTLGEESPAQYCTAGLAYRLYESFGLEPDPVRDNTVLAMAAIGTCADVVSLLDAHSLNRSIVRDGLKAIDGASPQNFDFVAGHMLSACGIGTDRVTARKISFTAAPFINAASRMGEVWNINGAQFALDALLSSPDDMEAYISISEMREMNEERKNLLNAVRASGQYNDAVREIKNGEANIGVFVAPEGTPKSLCGPIAGKLCESCGKPVIAVVNTPSGYAGSGRNPAGSDSLYGLLARAFSDGEAGSALGPAFKFGGHRDAVGVSGISDIGIFTKAVLEASAGFKVGKPELFLDEKPDGELLEKLIALEPVGSGLEIPPLKITGKEQYRDKLFFGREKIWKRIRIKPDGQKAAIDISCFDYSPEAYAQDRNGRLSILAVPEADFYGGDVRLSLTAAGTADEKDREKDSPAPEVNRT